MKTARKAMSTAASDSFDWASSHAGDFPASHLGEDVHEDEELIRLMSKAVEELELEWAPPAIPECGSMDKWFLQPGHCRTTSFQRPAPFFTKVDVEVSKMWHASYSARAYISGPALLNMVEGADARGYENLPPVEEVLATHLCPDFFKVKSSIVHSNKA